MNIFDFIGEATEYDKKHAVERNKPKSWLKTVSAFANTVGGVLVFGVADNDEMIGLEDIKSDAEFVSQKVKERISPYPEVILEPLKIGGKYFLYIKSLTFIGPMGLQKPTFVLVMKLLLLMRRR